MTKTDRALLLRTLPLLIRLGDFIDNGPVDPTREESIGLRCDLIGDIKTALEAFDAEGREVPEWIRRWRGEVR